MFIGMNKALALMLLLAATTSFQACECSKAYCPGNGGIINIRLMHNGANAVFGPQAYIDQDSVELSPDYLLFFMESSQSLLVSLKPNTPVIMTYTGEIDTLTCTTNILSPNDCCNNYSLATVHRNGKLICSGNCEDIIDLEIQ